MSKLKQLASKDILSSFTRDKVEHECEIYTEHDITIPHVLQSCLFMMTHAETGIMNNLNSSRCENELLKLRSIFWHMSNLPRKLSRPSDYPSSPRVAIVAGLKASRGMTFQNPFIDFTCTSFCFTDTSSDTQRGAQNAQKFGRACGMLAEAFARPGRQPYLIATHRIMKDALVNEKILCERVVDLENGTRISLKDFIPEHDYQACVKRVVASIKKTIDLTRLRDQEAMTIIKAYYAISNNGTQPFTCHDIKNYHDQTARIIEEKSNNRKYLRMFQDQGYVTCMKMPKRQMFRNRFTDKGVDYVMGLLMGEEANSA